MANNAVYSSYPTGDHSKVDVFTSEYKGKGYLNIRGMYNTEKNPEWQFGKGLSLTIDEIDVLDSIIAGLQKAKEAIES